jgi:hypothetical protein
MSTPPDHPKIYHITHVENLPSILADGGLLSDAVMIARGGPTAAIGISAIKRRRLEELNVECHPGTKVGDYVPFYFCPRSIMLYKIYRANDPDLPYRGGQGPILHLAADLRKVVAWATKSDTRWAFCSANAGAYYTQSLFRASLDALDEIDWAAVASTDFRPERVKDAKQSEFLIFETCPWELVARVGVKSAQVQSQVEAVLADAPHHPPVQVRPEWYY